MHSIDLVLKENCRHDADDLLSKILENRSSIPHHSHVQFELINLTQQAIGVLKLSAIMLTNTISLFPYGFILHCNFKFI